MMFYAVGTGYEGALEKYFIMAKNYNDAMRALYFQVNGYYDEDALDFAEHLGIKTESEWDKVDGEQQIENMDPADFILDSVFNIDKMDGVYGDGHVAMGVDWQGDHFFYDPDENEDEA